MHVRTDTTVQSYLSVKQEQPFQSSLLAQQKWPVTAVQDLESHLFGNPHSQHGWSGNVGSAAAVAEARQLTLQMCNAPLGQYECVFTSGTTGEHSLTHSQCLDRILTRHMQIVSRLVCFWANLHYIKDLACSYLPSINEHGTQGSHFAEAMRVDMALCRRHNVAQAGTMLCTVLYGTACNSVIHSNDALGMS